MNKRILHISLFLILAITENVIAQQGIGTNTPHRSAALDIESENKGILIPRVKLTALNIAAPIVSPIVGLTVYNTNNIDGLPSGFYFWKNDKWNRFYSTEDSIDTDTKTKVTGSGAIKVTPEDLLFNDINTYNVSVKTATNDSLGVVKPGDGLSVNNGTLSVKSKTLSGIGITVNLGTTEGTSTSAQNSVLADVTLGIANNAITSDKIENETIKTEDLKDASVTTEKVKSGGNDKVLSTNHSGIVQWIDKSTLDTNTISVVERQENHDYVNVNVSNSNNINTYKVGVSPATDSRLGVVKPGSGLSVNNGTLSVKNALPKFFYAPAIYIPTHNLNNGELLTDPLPINLYTEYTKQFTWQGGSATQFVSTDNIYGQARSSSTAVLPIVASSDLDYFITYYDASVFYDVAVSNEGIMTYKVKNNAVVTPKTFINIVFKVKD